MTEKDATFHCRECRAKLQNDLTPCTCSGCGFMFCPQHIEDHGCLLRRSDRLELTPQGEAWVREMDQAAALRREVRNA